MAGSSSTRLKFGPKKYLALHLLIARWLRHDHSGTHYCYVTLGGTELRDVLSFRFIDRNLISNVWSYEVDKTRYKEAQATSANLVEFGVNVEVRNRSVFSHKRESVLPHIFFFDFTGVCAFSDYHVRFGDLFQREVIKEGDCVLITSHLGHNHSKGWKGVRTQFGSEFAILGIDDEDFDSVRSVFRRAHPSMTLFKGLCRNQLQSEMNISCFGAVKYMDTSPMAIYGYTVAHGHTELQSFVGSVADYYFDAGLGRICPAASF